VTDPKLAVDVNRTRWYRNPNRHENAPLYRGVTGIVAAAPKEGIPRWAANTVAEYAVSYMDQWRDLPAMDAVDFLKRVPWRTRDRAAARGTEIHAVMERLMTAQPLGVPVELEPWIQGAERFVQECFPEPELMETTCFNESHMHAGTFDFLGRLKAFPELGRCLIDWKTGKSIYDDMGIQVVGGYALGAEYYLDANNVEHEWLTPDTALVCHLSATDGYQLHPVPMDRRWRRAFLACLEIRKWQQDGPKVGKPFTGPENFDLLYLKSLIHELDTVTALEVSTWAHENGIPTRPAVMNNDHIQQIIGFIKLLEIRAPEPTALRPMP
jgi:hypothetical protein